MTTLKHKRRELEAELKRLQKSTRHSQYYSTTTRRQNKARPLVIWKAVKIARKKRALYSLGQPHQNPQQHHPDLIHLPSYSPISHDDDIDFTQEVVDLTSGRPSDDSF